YLLTGRAVPRRGAPHSEDWPSYGAVLSKLGRGHGPLPPFVSMMPEVPKGAPRFVEESHGKGAGWLGPGYNPLQINATASLPEYRVADFNLRAEVPLARIDRRKALLHDLERQVRSLEKRADFGVMRGHYERAFSLLASRPATAAFDLSQEPLT